MKIKNLILITLGFLLLGLGAVGVLVPVLPTTPFVLAAAACFSLGSKKAHELLCKNPVFGPYIENYRTKQGIKKSLKIATIIFLWTGLAVSMIIIQKIWVCIILAVIGIGVTIHLLLIKTKKKIEEIE